MHKTIKEITVSCMKDRTKVSPQKPVLNVTLKKRYLNKITLVLVCLNLKCPLLHYSCYFHITTAIFNTSLLARFILAAAVMLLFPHKRLIQGYPTLLFIYSNFMMGANKSGGCCRKHLFLPCATSLARKVFQIMCKVKKI